MFILDLTRATGASSMEELLGCVAAYCQVEGFPTDQRTVFARPDQEAHVVGGFAYGDLRVVPGLDELTPNAAMWVTPRYVRGFISSLKSTTERVLLTSYAASVLNCWRELPKLPFSVETISLGDLKKAVMGEPRNTSHTTFDGLLSLQDYLDALQVVLQAPENRWGIRQTQLRPALLRVDSRLQPDRPGPKIGAVVDAAERMGWLQRNGGLQGDELLVPKLGSPPSVGDASGVKPLSSSQAKSQLEEERAIEPSTPPLVRLSHEMEKYLANRHLGPFSRVRALLFEAMSEPSIQSGVTVEEFVSSVVSAARDDWDANALPSPPPWARVRLFLSNMLSKAGVLLDTDGLPIQIHFGTYSRNLGQLAQDWRRRCEAELLLALLGRFEISEYVLADVAFALYNNDREGLSEVTKLVGFLLAEEKAVVSEAGTLVLPSGPPVEEQPSD